MKNASFIVLLLTLASCYSIPEIENFDIETWKKDARTCEDTRIKLAQTLIAQSDKLLGEGEAEIKGLLGKPSEHELYNRNQKFFYYNLHEENCPDAKRLSIKFDALDRAKEVRIISWRNK